MRPAAPISRALLIATLLLATSCGSARRSEPLTGPLDTSDARVELGQRVFAVHCGECHPRGEGGLAPAINNKPLPGWLIRFQVRNGLGAMPSFSAREISRDELDAVVLYLKRLRAQTPLDPAK